MVDIFLRGISVLSDGTILAVADIIIKGGRCYSGFG